MFRIKNKISYFGLEFDHDSIPNAIVIASSRPQKVIKWVNEYKPIVITREDGTEVRRERTAVQCPIGFRLGKDEIHNAMKRNKTKNYQDGKFFVILDHRIGLFEHPDTVKMKKDELRKKVADEKRLKKADAETSVLDCGPGNPPEPVGATTVDPDSVAVQDGPVPDTGHAKSVTESGLEVTDKRSGRLVTADEKQVI